MDLFDAKVKLLQSLSMEPKYAKGTVLEHKRNGTWSEHCPSERCWHFRSNNGQYSAVVYWYEREVVFYRLAKFQSIP